MALPILINLVDYSSISFFSSNNTYACLLFDSYLLKFLLYRPKRASLLIIASYFVSFVSVASHDQFKFP